jgi:uncharacterized C2H2 Zn-finger protein
MSDRGREYCAADDNMCFGHVEQIGSSDSLRKILLRCPRCGWLYQASASGPKDAAQHLGGRGCGAVHRLAA